MVFLTCCFIVNVMQKMVGKLGTSEDAMQVQDRL